MPTLRLHLAVSAPTKKKSRTHLPCGVMTMEANASLLQKMALACNCTGGRLTVLETSTDCLFPPTSVFVVGKSLPTEFPFFDTWRHAKKGTCDMQITHPLGLIDNGMKSNHAAGFVSRMICSSEP